MINWIITQIQNLFIYLSQFLNAQVFQIGEKGFSLSLIGKLIILILIVFVTARLISEWIKRRLLVRMGFDRGSREAIAAVISYLTAGIGLLMVLQSTGINFSSLAVFAGALGLGLSFSLQNFASNFVSGLTLLLERPVKVGDFIEVDNLSGTVENISIRSTVIRTIDGIFVIIPNIRFVENNITNWSYRDPKCRLHIPVGVDFGTDPVLVTEAMLAAARMESEVLSYPSPKVWFRGFQECDLLFELLVWINNPPESEEIKSALYFRIENEFRERGIEIPFPQRNLYIRNLDQIQDIFQKQNIPSIPEAANFSQPPISPDISHTSLPKSPNNWTLRDLLRRITYFESCSDLELRRLIEYGYRQLFPAGTLVCQENDPGDSFYIILTGSVEVYSQRIEQYIATLHDGEFFGEISLLLGIPRSATVKTIEDSILFVVERHDLQKLLVNHPGLADQIAQKLSERQQALQDLGLLIDTPSEETPFIWVRKRLQLLFGI
jgi:potassium efflux system protein